ncbi:hypothetical protein QQM79_10265 [Marinobacteraceae bacterium S3BR75-40.1]
MPYRLCALWLMVIVTLGLAGCLGSGDSSSGGSSKTQQQGQDSTDQESETPDTRMGYFVDAPVQGLIYSSQSTSGKTDELGGYEYEPGETVTFRLGENLLGTIEGQWMSTPLDLAPGGKATDNASRNLTRLLVTLDADANPDNGIKIEDSAHNAFRSGLLSFDLDPELFASSDAVQNGLKYLGITGLVPISFTDRHLAETLDYLPNLQTREHIQTWIQHERTYNGNVANYNGSMEAVRRVASLFWFDELPHLSLGWFVKDLSADKLIEATQQLSCDQSDSQLFSGNIVLDCDPPSTSEVDRYGLDISNFDTAGGRVIGDVLVASDTTDSMRNGAIGRWHHLNVEHMEIFGANAQTFVIEGSIRYWASQPTLDKNAYQSTGKYVFEDVVFKNKNTGAAFRLIDFELERFGKKDSDDQSVYHYYLSLNGDVYHYREGFVHVQTKDEWSLNGSNGVVVKGQGFRPLGGSSLYFLGATESKTPDIGATLQVFEGYDEEGLTPDQGRVKIERYDETQAVAETAFYENSNKLGKIRLETAPLQVLGDLKIREAVGDDAIIQANEDLMVTIPEVYDPNTGKLVPTEGVWLVNGAEVSDTQTEFSGADSATLAQAETDTDDEVGYRLTSAAPGVALSDQVTVTASVVTIAAAAP